MQFADHLRNSRLLRRPLLAASKTLFSLLRGGPPLLRRAAYDAMPVPYLVTGHPEHFVVSTADKVIGREVFLHGEFDFAKLQTALAILAREGHPAPTHLIDVGANIGTITIPALKRGLIQTATAIEPHPHNLRLLRTNIALNGLEDRTEAPPPIQGNAYEQGLAQLPASWGAAIDAFATSPEIKRIFPAHLIENFVMTKRQELHYLAELTPEERVEHYLDTV